MKKYTKEKEMNKKNKNKKEEMNMELDKKREKTAVINTRLLHLKDDIVDTNKKVMHKIDKATENLQDQK